MTRSATIVLALCASLMFAHAAASAMRLAASATAPGFQPGDTASHVRIASVRRDSGDRDKIVVTVEIDPGFHINANPASDDYLIPTKLNVTNQPPLRVIYPAPIRFKPKFSDHSLDVFEGTIQITAQFPPRSLNRDPHLYGSVTAQACTEDICLPPADLPLPHLSMRTP